MNWKKVSIIALGALYISFSPCYSQVINLNGGILAKAEITLGNQNQWFKIGIFGFGIINYGDISIESGISLASYRFLKRHTVATSGIGYSYEFFAMGGVGKNSNLLGSAVSEMNTSILFNPNGKSGFHGLGFGVSKDYLPGKLKSYGVKRGSFLMRFSNAHHSIHFSFLNDFKIGWFKGAGTDYAVTGTLQMGYTDIYNQTTVRQLGFGVDLFTPQPDYGKPPRNKTNSDDGRKNVWFTLPPFRDLFYGNIYGFASYQKEYVALHTKLGVNSQKTGAFIQNTLHDGPGLNPRFPWEVTTIDKLYLELSGTALLNLYSND